MMSGGWTRGTKADDDGAWIEAVIHDTTSALGSRQSSCPLTATTVDSYVSVHHNQPRLSAWP